ncbi:hydrocephalus-inducing protein-like isoform X1, partial [Silurus asotus]
LNISTKMLEFDSVICGMCKVVSVQLHNPEPVPCKWSIKEEEQIKRKKVRLEKLTTPLIFEILPSSGILYPDDRVNIQVRFSPAEERMYRERLLIAVAQSTQRILLIAQGQGLEPQLEFSTPKINLGPLLPCSNGEEVEVLVRNPCPFPIEFYSLDFDKQYLEEENILRLMKGYDARNILLLPPRAPGEPLPTELLDYYQEYKSQNLEPDRVKDNTRTNKMGDLEVNPVSKAIANYIGVYLSPEEQAPHICRGIGIVVHGAPLSGKTALAVSLARYYGAACLNIDSVVQEAVTSGTSSASKQARELF